MLFDIDQSDRDKDSSEISPYVMSTPEVDLSDVRESRESITQLFDPDLKRKIEELLSSGDPRIAMSALVTLGPGFFAERQWDTVHRSGAHELSKQGRINRFAYEVAERVKITPNTRVFNMGCGLGGDDILMATKGARIVAVDGSEMAIALAKKSAAQQLGENSNRIEFVQGNFISELYRYNQSPVIINMVYAHSSLHYWPGDTLEKLIFPRIWMTLNRNPISKREGKEFGQSRGRFCLALKTAKSASANSEYQIHLNVPHSNFLHAIDTKDHMLRIYPKDKEALLNALSKYFDIHYCEEVTVESYDKAGDKEIFLYIIASPKRKGITLV